MTKFRRTLALLLVLTMMFSLGEVLVLADGAEPGGNDVVADGTGNDGGVVETEPTDAPAPTEGPASTEEPAPTEEPVPTEEPAPTDVPASTEGPEATEEPAATDAPVSTEAPAGTDTPAPTEEPTVPPEVSEEPEASPEPTEEPEKKVWPWTEPGNSSASLMGGGWELKANGDHYYSENGLYLNGSLLSGADALNLNLSDGWLYYTVGSDVQRMSAGGGSAETVLTAPASIGQMYVMGQEVRYLAGGCLYSYDMTDGMTETLECPAGTLKFIPTPYGNLFLTGSLFNYTLWAEQTQLYSGISKCYTEDDWLVVIVNGETYQTATAALFEGSISLQAYVRNGVMTISNLSEDAQLAAEAAYYDSAEYAAHEASLTPVADSGIMTVSNASPATVSLSANQQNIVMRAQQMSEARWTALADLYAWGGNDEGYVRGKNPSSNGNKYIVDVNGVGSGDVDTNKKGFFLQNHIYKGVPYSWPIGFGYVGWDISLNDFLKETNTQGGKFYSSYSSYERRAPYYGSDCSGFASYAWDLPSRCTCSSILKYATMVGNGKDIDTLLVGDVVNNPSSHVSLITYVGYDSNGKVVSVEVTEQTPPKMRVTMYGQAVSGRNYNYTSTLSGFSSYYLNGGYSIYRRACSTKPNVSRPEDVLNLSTPPAPSIDSIEAVGPTQLKVTLKHEDDAAKIYYTTNGTTPTDKSTQYTGPITLDQSSVKDSKISIRAIATVPDKTQDSFLLAVDLGLSATPTLALAADGSSVLQYNNDFYVTSGAEVTLTSAAGGTIYYTTDGSTPSASSTQVSSGTKIKVTGNMTIKAFAAADNCLPSAVATFSVKTGKLHTITLDDPYGFIKRDNDAEKVYVMDGQSISFEVSSTIGGFTLDKVEVDGTATSKFPIPFNNVTGDHTIKTYVKTNYTDLHDQNGKPGWYIEAVSWASANGLMNGTSTNVFSPTYGASRAMFITVLGRYAKAKLEVSTSSTSHKSIDPTTLDASHRVGVTNGIDILVRSQPSIKSATATVNPLEAAGMLIEVTGSQVNEGSIWFQINYDGKTGYVRQINPTNGKVLLDVCNFSDITADNLKYCNGYIQWAYVNDLVEGINSDQFGPTNGISRQDICVLLYKYLTEMLGLRLPTSQSSLSRFKDQASISDYAKTAVSAMVNIGVIQGDTSGNFAPTKIAQRAQVAQIFLNLDKYLDGKV